jgi:hypothetical protein
MSTIESTDKKILDTNNSPNEFILNKPEEKENIPFWSEDPNILFKQPYMFEIFPTETMTYSQKLNATSRMVLYLTIILFLFTRNFRILIMSLITMGIIWFLFFNQEREKMKLETKKINLDKNVENFDGLAKNVFDKNQMNIPSEVFSKPSSSNPFSNVLVTDYDYNVNKKPAEPAFDSNVNNEILEQAKQLVRELNPDQPDISDKLFKDLGDEYLFEKSLQPFYSNPGTTIPNDQQGFADFCYGSMVSCKEGNLFACARNLSRHTN